uniref:Ig-like domain-containing protein n=1 Tax=Cyanoderma ruficeps TaxID=181631 RepID=A0A8C3QNG1_9PASS
TDTTPYVPIPLCTRCHPHPALSLLPSSWCPLSPAGPQTTQLLVEPPWRPAVLWDLVTLTCQGSGTAGATTWYKDGQRWWQKGPDHLFVTKSGTYTCYRPSSGLSPPMSVLNDRLVLQVPARALLEGDRMTLRCRVTQDMSVTGVRFYHKDKDLGRPVSDTELSVSPLQLHHSGHYHCGGLVGSGMSQWQNSAPVTVTVHGEHPHIFTSPLLPRAFHGASAGGSLRIHRGVPPQSQLPQHPEPPEAPSPPPAPLLPGWAVGGGPTEVPAAPAARRGGLP